MRKNQKALHYFILAVLLTVIGGAGALQLPQVQSHIVVMRQRAAILYLASRGEIRGLNFHQALAIVRRNSPYYLQLIELSRDAYHSITNPYAGPNDIAAGSVLFQSDCARCHGFEGRGGIGAPALVGRTLRYGDSDWALFQTIRGGIAGSTMPPHAWTEKKIWQTIAYLESRSPSDAGAMGSGTSARAIAPVSYEELAKITNPGKDWLSYSGSYSGTRHSSLTQVTCENVGHLVPRWIFQFPQERYHLEDSPLENDGMVFANAPDSVVALDAVTGRKIWNYDRPLPAHVQGCCGVQSRGLAILDARVYFGTYDDELIALSAATGAQLWRATIADYHEGFSISGAPLAYRQLVVTGVGGGDYPMRGGFIAAYEAATGKEVWRFRAVPAPGQAGHDTWPGGSWRNGGGGTWVTGSYDTNSDVLYWGVGNPNPDFDVSSRKGDNLYTESVVALSGTTGKLLWHFQFVPEDDHDYDAVEVPQLIDRPGTSTPKELVVAERNGLFYALDRTNGRFLFAKPFVHQTWAKGLDASGRPISNPEAKPSPSGTVVYPGERGATNWWSASYDPALDLFFVPTLEAGGIFFAEPGFGEIAAAPLRRGPVYVSVTAIDAANGDIAWRYRRPATYDTEVDRGGILSTAGGVLFASQGSTFFALDSRTGKLLWTFHTGGHIFASPISYEAGGHQYILITSGNSLIAFSLADYAPTTASGRSAAVWPRAGSRRE